MKILSSVVFICLGIICLDCNVRGQGLTAKEILAKLEAQYGGLRSLSVEGRVISDLEMPGGKAPAAQNLDEMKWDLGTPGRVTIFSVRLAKPNLYRIEWSQNITAGYTNTGAAWSAGNGDFLLLGGKTQPIEGGMDMALAAATGVSGGVANTLPSVFFQRQTNWLKSLSNLALLPQEQVGKDLCYVLSGELNGVKLVLWVSSDYRLKQKRQVLGGQMKMPEVSDEDMKKTLKQLGQDASPEALERMKETMKSMMAMTTNAKGSITEKYETSELNPVVRKETFDHELTPKDKP